MKVLLLQDDELIRDRVAFVLESQFNATVIQAGTPAAARSSLKKEEAEGAPFQLIVIDCDRSEEREAERLRNDHSAIQSVVFLRGRPDKPIAISAPPGRPVPVFIDRGDIIQNLISTVGALVKQEFLPHPEDDRNFCKIRTKLLLSVCPLRSDIFIRLSESKYLKLFREGDNFDLQDMEKYTVKKGVEYLYIGKNRIREFIQKFQAELQKYLDRKPEMSFEQVAELGDSVLETVQELGSSVGFTEEVQGMVRTQLALTVKSMGKSPRLSRVLGKLEGFRGKYIASHSSMCAYLACSIASQMQWGSETTFHKLTLASFLHDITLGNHELAECESLKEAGDGSFTEAEKKAFREHPAQGAEIARRFSEVPPDVDVIIAQHHERADGTGFPRGLGAAYIAPLSAIFIVAHDMTRFALRTGPGFHLQEFLDAARERYRPSQFRKVVQAIEQLDG